jgi:hypothetical protein
LICVTVLGASRRFCREVFEAAMTMQILHKLAMASDKDRESDISDAGSAHGMRVQFCLFPGSDGSTDVVCGNLRILFVPVCESTGLSRVLRTNAPDLRLTGEIPKRHSTQTIRQGPGYTFLMLIAPVFATIVGAASLETSAQGAAGLRQGWSGLKFERLNPMQGLSRPENEVLSHLEWGKMLRAGLMFGDRSLEDVSSVLAPDHFREPVSLRSLRSA